MFYTIFGNCSVISVYCPLAIGKPRVSPLLSLNMMKVRNQPKLRRVCPLGNPNNPVVILRFAISSDSADRGRSIIRVIL
jgi:hypothetical protein